MEELKDQVKVLQQQLQQLLTQRTQVDDRDEEMNFEDEEDEGEGDPSNCNVFSSSSWQSVLGGSRQQPTQAMACNLVDLLESPPPMSLLKSDSLNITPYIKIPSTPSSRKNIMDQKLYMPQKKLEEAMQHMVHSLETHDPQGIQVAAGFVRSAWEDLNQGRRELFAGRQRNKLDKRTDDNRPRLLTREEEIKIQQAPRFQGNKGQGNKQAYPRQQYPRQEQPQGKGKGKGKGRKTSPGRAAP